MTRFAELARNWTGKKVMCLWAEKGVWVRTGIIYDVIGESEDSEHIMISRMDRSSVVYYPKIRFRIINNMKETHEPDIPTN